MRRKLMWLVLFCAAILVVAHLLCAKRSGPHRRNSGFKAMTHRRGTFEEIDVFQPRLQRNRPSRRVRGQGLAIAAEDQGTVGPVRAEQFLAACQPMERSRALAGTRTLVIA